MPTHSPLTYRRIFWFWLPLAAMWLIMSTEGPSITGIISRLPDDRVNLAAFGVTFSLALLVESPVIMLLSAGTALATDRPAYRRLLNFTHVLALTQTALHLILALTPLYAFILRNIIRAPEEIIEVSRVAFLLTAPWTAMIAYRRLHEGVMIRYGHPQRVTVVILVRIAATLAMLFAGLAIGRWPGAYVGGAALSVGVTAGALAAYWLARAAVRSQLPAAGPAPGLTWARLGSFYTPLALTTLLTMLVNPVITTGLSQAPHPLDSLAVWPVVTSLLFLGRSFGMAYSEVAIALLDTRGAYALLRRFAWLLTAGATALFALVALPGVATLWYRYVSGLGQALIDLALLPTAIVVIVPGLTALVSWQRALLMHSRATAPISVAVGLNLAILVALMLGLPRLVALPGAVVAAIALSASSAAEYLYLWWRSRPVTARLRPAGAQPGAALADAAAAGGAAGGRPVDLVE
jgi:hypothetical protein